MQIKEGWLKAIIFFILYLIFAGIFDSLGTVVIHDLTGIENSSGLNKFAYIRNYLKNPENLFFLITYQSFQFFGLLLLLFVFKKAFHFNLSKWLLINRNGYRNFNKGFLLGVFTVIVIIVYIYLKSYIAIERFSILNTRLLGYILLFFLVALIEEIAYRGFILGNLKESVNKYIALIISSTLFAVVHSLNPNVSLLSLINLFLAGLILGLTFIMFNSLWMPIGFHFSWNLFQGPILGFNISGIEVDSIFKIKHIEMDKSYTGGDFGLEGSIITTIVLVIIIVILNIYYQTRFSEE